MSSGDAELRGFGPLPKKVQTPYKCFIKWVFIRDRIRRKKEDLFNEQCSKLHDFLKLETHSLSRKVLKAARRKVIIKQWFFPKEKKIKVSTVNVLDQIKVGSIKYDPKTARRMREQKKRGRKKQGIEFCLRNGDGTC